MEVAGRYRDNRKGSKSALCVGANLTHARQVHMYTWHVLDTREACSRSLILLNGTDSINNLHCVLLTNTAEI